MDRVSIIMPTYNQKPEYLKEAIDSAINQTYENKEIIVVDDGSTDETTKKICEFYGDKIKYIYQENKKTSGALNTGIKNMTGEWFAWLSTDDMWHPNKIEEQMKMASEEKKVIYSDWVYIDQFGNKIKNLIEPEFKSQKEMQFHLCHRFFACGSVALIHKSVFEKVGTFNEELPFSEDYEMWFRIAKEFMFYKVPIILMRYRTHQDSLTNTVSFTNVNRKIRYNGRKLLGYNPKVSVVIPAYNEEKNIVNCVNAIIKEDLVDEIIVVNDGSIDKTSELINNYKKNYVGEKEIIILDSKERKGRGAARNLGMRLTENQFIVTIDADVIAIDGWLKKLMTIMDDEWLDIVAGSVRWVTENEFWGNTMDYVQTMNAKKSIGTALTLFKKHTLEDIGYMDDSMSDGEDSEMFLRLQKRGYVFRKIPQILGEHRSNRTLIEWLNRQYVYGKNRALIYSKHSDVMKEQVSEEELSDINKNPQNISNIMMNLLYPIGTLGFREELSKIKEVEGIDKRR